MHSSTKLRRLTGLAHDFDGVFYNFSHTPNLFEDAKWIWARTFCETLPNILSLEEAAQLALDGYNEHGDAITGFIKLAEQHYADKAPSLIQTMFQTYHRRLFRYISERFPHIFTPSRDLLAGLSATNHIQRGIATNGCARSLAKPFIEASGISSYFHPDAYLGMNDIGFVNKATDANILLACINALGVDIRESGYVEDSTTNLQIAKDRAPDLTTIFIHHGNPAPHLPAYIDFQFETLAQMKLAIAKALADHPIQVPVSVNISRSV